MCAHSRERAARPRRPLSCAAGACAFCGLGADTPRLTLGPLQDFKGPQGEVALAVHSQCAQWAPRVFQPPVGGECTPCALRLAGRAGYSLPSSTSQPAGRHE